MTPDTTLFGTSEPPVARAAHSAGPWGLTLEGGALRHITLHQIEAIRGIAFLVRDRDWGTLAPVISNPQTTRSDDRLQLSYDATFTSGTAQLSVHVLIEVAEDQLSMSATGHADAPFETNRAGFTVLHPIADVAGRAVRVTHSDGSFEDTCFPELIAPWQPFMDISALTHTVGQAAVTCLLQGDTFEMEDQRQWGDASFKTYNRPLAKPWPYRIEQGKELCQSVTLTWDVAKPAKASPPQPQAPLGVFPEMALVIDAQDAWRLSRQPQDLRFVNPQRVLCHFDATLGETAAQFGGFAAAQAACPDQRFDLELICGFDADPEAELAGLATQMRTSGFDPDSVLVCPSVDRQSTPPGSYWPDCPPMLDIHNAAARAFPNKTRGGGMVSFFPELNRKRPPVAVLDFVSHGLCPIVHAADDISVMETLETIAHITCTARGIIGKKDYRIGPATIAMRQNPYGDRTIPNPHHNRVAMAHDDPRHRAKFGAAYSIGLATALAPAGVTVWTPAAVYGPRGIGAEEDNRWPIAQSLAGLAKLSGLEVNCAQIAQGRARLSVGNCEVTANLCADPVDGLEPFGWSMTEV
jgi:hypothetical protein